MADRKISLTGRTSAPVPTASPAVRRVSIRARLTARLHAERFDRMLAVGAPAPAGSALAVHAARLTSPAERIAVSRTLSRAVHDARSREVTMSMRVPVYRQNVTAAAGVIDAVILRLHSPLPVSPRGMARLRKVLADGSGPLYRFGRGDLGGRLGAALAAL